MLTVVRWSEILIQVWSMVRTQVHVELGSYLREVALHKLAVPGIKRETVQEGTNRAIEPHYQIMGNITSNTKTLPSDASCSRQPPRTLRRKFSCMTAWSSQVSLHSGTGTTSTSTAASRTSVTYEKTVSIAQETLVRPEDSHDSTSTELNAAFATFLDEYPEYRQTWIIDSLRRSDYARLSRTEETYVDYMGGALFPESLVQVHSDFITRAVMGNTHSVSNRYVCHPSSALAAPLTLGLQLADVLGPRRRGPCGCPVLLRRAERVHGHLHCECYRRLEARRRGIPIP